jgi:hypothetical protein
MNQQEIFKNMTKGYWQYGVFNQVTCRQGHPLDGKVKDIAPHVVNDCDGRAIVTAVNWWQKLMGQGINPESVETLVKLLEEAGQFIQDVIIAKYAGMKKSPDLITERIKEALTAATLH